MLETLTIAVGLGALGFLVYWLRRRLSAREGADIATAGDAGAMAPAERPDSRRLQPVTSRGPDHPLAVLMQQDLFLQLAEALDAAVLIHDEKIRFANAGAARVFGTPSVSLRDTELESYVHPEYRDGLKQYLQERLDGADVTEGKVLQLIDSEDRSHWVELRPFSVGQGLLGSVIRPSHAHAMEAATQAGRSLARQTLDSIGEGVLTADTEGRSSSASSTKRIASRSATRSPVPWPRATASTWAGAR